jgi:hypothetical protein
MVYFLSFLSFLLLPSCIVIFSLTNTSFFLATSLFFSLFSYYFPSLVAFLSFIVFEFIFVFLLLQLFACLSCFISSNVLGELLAQPTMILGQKSFTFRNQSLLFSRLISFLQCFAVSVKYSLFVLVSPLVVWLIVLKGHFSLAKLVPGIKIR